MHLGGLDRRDTLARFNGCSADIAPTTKTVVLLHRHHDEARAELSTRMTGSFSGACRTSITYVLKLTTRTGFTHKCLSGTKRHTREIAFLYDISYENWRPQGVLTSFEGR